MNKFKVGDKVMSRVDIKELGLTRGMMGIIVRIDQTCVPYEIDFGNHNHNIWLQEDDVRLVKAGPLTTVRGKDAPLECAISSVTVNETKRIVTVVFKDGDVQIVHCNEEDNFDVEIGIALAIAHRFCGSIGKFHKEVARLVSSRKAIKGKVESPVAKPVTGCKFKVGDKVEVINNGKLTHFLGIGTKATIKIVNECVCDDHRFYTYLCETPKGLSQYVAEEDLKLVEETSRKRDSHGRFVKKGTK